jgi:transglutaminase/protease-like cytokinesis protein 3
MAEDRKNQKLVVYKKDGTKVVEGTAGASAATITGLAGGTAVAAGDYQVAFSDGTSESDKVDVPAFSVPAAKVAVTGVTMAQKTASFKVGDKKQVIATVAPDDASDKTVTYASDNEAVATVAADGTITAVSVGNANITTTTHDGSKTDKCAVTVSAAS